MEKVFEDNVEKILKKMNLEYKKNVYATIYEIDFLL